MAKKKMRDETSSAISDLTESQEIQKEDITKFDKEREKYIKKLVEADFQMKIKQMKEGLESEKNECDKQSVLMQKVKKYIKRSTANGTIEDDMKMITKHL